MEIGTIKTVDIDQQMRTAYLDYAMSVIVSRALPDVRDGLKPVHRRILYGMYDMGLRSNSAFKKSARIVGDVLGKYHPHGDMAIYDAMARLVQGFSMRYPLVDGQGNFGSIDGDAPAAMRYTEARLKPMAEEILRDIDKGTVDFVANFDGSLREPGVMPARLPNLLLNGASGIAVGMATSVPPHNLGEICAAITHLIDHYDHIEDISNDDLMEFVPGPDFPTGGRIIGQEGIRQAYSTGRGRLIVRGQAQISETKGGRYTINLTEIPYQVNKTTLIERIADLAREGRIDAISDLRDESDRRGMSIVIELKRNAQPRHVLNQLFKYTPLQTTFSIQLLALVKGEPRLLSLKRTLQLYIEHRQQVITRRTHYELNQAVQRAHILEGLLTALANLDAVIQTIRQAPDSEQAKLQLVRLFNLSEAQALAILDMQLRRLSGLERLKIEEELRQVLDRIGFYNDLLANPQKILDLIKIDLHEMNEKYKDDRRTQIIADAPVDLNEEDLVPDEPILITITQRGYIKRMAVSAYRLTSRGRRGMIGQAVREEDEVQALIPARTRHTIFFFSDRGKVYSEKAYQIPDANRTDRGIPVINILPLQANERITAALAVPDLHSGGYFCMATVQGQTKRVPLEEFAAVRPSGVIALKLEEGDELGWVRLTSGEDEIILVTAQGHALRLAEGEIRSMGRQASGVTGISLPNGDQVAAMEIIEPGGYLMVATQNGFGKRSALDEYPTKGRASLGVSTLDTRNMDRTGWIATARVVQEDDEIMLISSGGWALRLKVKEIRPTGRATRGLHLMDLVEGDTVASIARLATVLVT